MQGPPPPVQEGGPGPSPRVPPTRGGLGGRRGGAEGPHPHGGAAGRAPPLPSPDCPWLGAAAQRAPLARSLPPRWFNAGRSAGGGLFPSSASPPLRAKPLSVPPHPPPRRLGRRRRLLGRGPSRPRRRRSPHCVSLTGSSPATPPPPPAPAPRNRKPTPAEKHPPAANSRTASRLEAGFPPGRRRPPPSPPDRQPLRPIGGGRVAKEAGAGVGTALGQAGSGRRGGWWEGVRPRRLSCPPPLRFPRGGRGVSLRSCPAAWLGSGPRPVPGCPSWA